MSAKADDEGGLSPGKEDNTGRRKIGRNLSLDEWGISINYGRRPDMATVLLCVCVYFENLSAAFRLSDGNPPFSQP